MNFQKLEDYKGRATFINMDLVTSVNVGYDFSGIYDESHIVARFWLANTDRPICVKVGDTAHTRKWVEAFINSL